MKKKVLSILVDNTSGVLSRISGLFSRRGYNIDSLTRNRKDNDSTKYSGDYAKTHIFREDGTLQDI